MSSIVLTYPTSPEVIDALGGTVEASKLMRVCPQAVSRMKRLGIPPKHIPRIRSVLPGALDSAFRVPLDDAAAQSRPASVQEAAQ